MRNGWRCSRIDRTWLVLGATSALALAGAVYVFRGDGTIDDPAALYRTRCSACHELADLSRFGRDEMANIVRTMREKNGADKVISDAEAQMIARYLEESKGK